MTEIKSGEPDIDTGDYELILNLLDIPTDRRQIVLDVGAGIGRAEIAAKREGLINTRVILLDVNYFKNPYMLKKVKENTRQGNIIAGDVFNLPIQPKSVDFSILNGGPVSFPKEYKDKIAKALAEATKTRIAVYDRTDVNDQNHQDETSTFVDSLKKLDWREVKSQKNPLAPGRLTILEKNSQA